MENSILQDRSAVPTVEKNGANCRNIHISIDMKVCKLQHGHLVQPNCHLPLSGLGPGINSVGCCKMRAGVAENSDWLLKLGKNIQYDWTGNFETQQPACPTGAACSASGGARLLRIAAP